jgi:hypothetical protein
VQAVSEHVHDLRAQRAGGSACSNGLASNSAFARPSGWSSALPAIASFNRNCDSGIARSTCSENASAPNSRT